MNDELEVTFAGKAVRFRSRELVYVGIIAVLILAIGWLVQFALSSWGPPFDIREAMTAQNRIMNEWQVQHAKEMDRQHEQFEHFIRVQTSVLAICLNPYRKAECERLDIDIPEEIRRKIYK